MTDWEVWCLGVIKGVGEPLQQVSVDTHWAWSNAETAPYDLMRWNNPQNSTEPWPNCRDSGAQPGLHDVKIYATIQDGIDATVYTLTKEPYYRAIVTNLRAGLPHQQWGATSTAGSELHAWGTGTNWLAAAPYFGPAPTDLIGVNDMEATDPDFQALIWRVETLIANLDAVPSGPRAGEKNVLKASLATSGGAVDLSPVLNAIAALKVELDATAADIATLKLRIEKDLAP